jgi:hypothetical protein
MIITFGWQVSHQNHKSQNIKAIILPGAVQQTYRGSSVYLRNQDTLAIPDDTVPNVLIPAGVIQAITTKPVHLNTGIRALGCMLYNNPEFIDPESIKLKWKGLFKANEQFYIGDTKLRLKRVHSEIDGTPNQKTGWLISCDHSDQNIILISGAKDIANGPVKKVLLSTKLYYAGQKLEFKYYGVKYTLYTKGFKRDGKIYNYKLFLLAKVKGYYIDQLLESLPAGVSFGGEGEMSTDIEIEFAGDLDGDRIPDFIISESGYSFGFTYLYLSGKAGKKTILKAVSYYGDTD